MEIWNAFSVSIASVWNDSGFSALTGGHVIMMLVGCFLLYMAFVKEYEPLLLSPIAFGCIMANFPKTGFMDEMNVMMAIHFGIAYEIFPPIIFMGVGAMTDFGPMIANPDTMLLGAAAQFGVFIALAGAMILGFDIKEAACIGIIGGADDAEGARGQNAAASSCNEVRAYRIPGSLHDRYQPSAPAGCIARRYADARKPLP